MVRSCQPVRSCAEAAGEFPSSIHAGLRAHGAVAPVRFSTSTSLRCRPPAESAGEFASPGLGTSVDAITAEPSGVRPALTFSS
jgi:hypothetical protein